MKNCQLGLWTYLDVDIDLVVSLRDIKLVVLYQCYFCVTVENAHIKTKIYLAWTMSNVNGDDAVRTSREK